MSKKALKIIGLILLVIILVIAEIVSIRGIFLLGSLVIFYRAFVILDNFFHYKDIDSENLKSLLNIPWVIFCIVFLVSYPLNIWLTIINLPIPEGRYYVDSEYHLFGGNEVYDENIDDYVYQYIDESGIATFEVYLGYNDVYDEDVYYSGAVEFSSVTVSYEANLSLLAVDLPNYGEINLDEELYDNKGDCEIEIGNKYYNLEYDFSDLSEESFGHTLENKINNISIGQIIEFALVIIASLVSILGFFFALKIKLNKEKIPSL